MVKWSVGYYLNKVYSLIFYISGESHQAISMERFVNVFECERFMHRFVSELRSLISATFVVLTATTTEGTKQEIFDVY